MSTALLEGEVVIDLTTAPDRQVIRTRVPARG